MTGRTVESVLEEFADVFGEDLSGRRCLHGKTKVNIKEGPVTPKHVMGARRPPQERQLSCKQYLDTLVKSDVIVL